MLRLCFFFLICLSLPLGPEAVGAVAYSRWMALSEVRRVPHSYLLTGGSGRPGWDYAASVELEAMLDVSLTYADTVLWNYVREYPRTMIDSLGLAAGYRLEDYNLDRIRPAKLVYRIHRIGGCARGEQLAMQRCFSQLLSQPRTAGGVFWHKKIYHDQVWLDGSFMALPFYVCAASLFQDSLQVGLTYDDAISQLLTIDSLTYDASTGLWKHAYDESRSLFWADPQTGRSRHSWARAMGWYCMAILEVLCEVPRPDPRWQELADLLLRVMKAVARCQSVRSHVWLDVLDVVDARNYLESSASCMFTYCMLKGARLGLLPESFRRQGLKAYRGILRQFIRQEPDGTISIRDCVAVSGLGPEDNPRRDGSFFYYMSEPVRDNDCKAVGPFIWASLEAERVP